MILAAVSALIAAIWFFDLGDFANRPVFGRVGVIIKETADVYRSEGRLFTKIFMISFAGNMLDTLAYLFAAYAIRTPITVSQTFIAGPLVTLSNMLPFSPGGAGTAEATASVLFAQLGLQSGALIIFLARVWVIILRSPGVVFYLFTRKKEGGLHSG
jgi:uncharacterized membrane protein YbhN (UPF0104 family)